MIFRVPFKFYASVLILGTPFVSGCQHIERINVAQFTYEMLRAEDCRLNDLEDFCGRTYAAEYHEYERTRQDYIRSEKKSVLRLVAPEDSTELSL